MNDWLVGAIDQGTTSTRMVLTRLQASRIRTGIGTRPWSTAIPIIRICTIGIRIEHPRTKPWRIEPGARVL